MTCMAAVPSLTSTPTSFVPLPETGRRVTRVRQVRLSDVTGTGRLRLDALARYLQDIAGDDVDDAGLGGAWVLRRVALAFGDLPVFRDEVTLTTFCSGTGSRWAERRTTLEVGGGARVEAVALWVFVDPAGRPVATRRLVLRPLRRRRGRAASQQPAAAPPAAG